jgi:DUF4097 and DUF4098 domain-containing protein YvlB
VRVATSPAIRAEGPRAANGGHWSASFEIAVPRRSDLRLSSVNGPVAVAEIEGRLDLSTTNGPLAVSRAAGRIKGRTTNGPVTAVLAGKAWTGEGLDLETTNGPVKIEVPSDYAARLEASSVNGPLHVDFPVSVESQSPRELRATLGQGGALLRARTTNGPVRVRRP